MSLDYPPLDINPVFPGHGEKEIIIIIIVVVVVFVVLLIIISIIIIIIIIIIILRKGKRVLWCFITALQTF